MAEPLVVGVGNRLRGDDAVGLVVADTLRARGVPAVDHDGDAAALLDSWAGAEQVVVVDAVTTGATPGSVVCRAASEPLFTGRAASTHGLGVAEAVELGRALGRLPERLVLVGVEGAEFDTGAPLSPAVEAAVPRAVETVLAELAARQR